MLDRVGAVQLDTISVLARSHELVAYARLGPMPRDRIERAYWHPGKPATFEYWAHAACILPLAEWPYYAFRRRMYRAQGQRWHSVSQAACKQVLAQLADGPLTATELGGAKAGGPWWDWSEVKIAAEWLLDIGTVVCRERRGFERVYDLAERAIPAALLDQDLDDETCARRLVESAGGALGIATLADLAAYHGMTVSLVRSVVAATSLRAVRVEGWRDRAYLCEGAEGGLRPGLRSRTVLLSPFDSLLWDRDRLQRLFGITYRLEAYVPAAKRIVGYFAMPVLAGDRLVGLVDPKRTAATLHARHVVVHDPRAVEGIARALHEAATWVSCDDVVVDRVTPTSATADLRAAVAR
jgi:uncharacterized protein YcaQ